MQVDFHYYATYAAAGFAGFSPAEMREIAEGAALVDFFNAAYLVKIGGPTEAATTQFQLDLADMTLNRQGIQEITQIWSSSGRSVCRGEGIEVVPEKIPPDLRYQQ